MICKSLRIIAETITMPFFPLFTSLSLNSFKIGLCCFATIAGKNNAFLKALLPLLHRDPLTLTDVPDSFRLEPKPANAVTSLAFLKFFISGNSDKIATDVLCPIPGMLSNNSTYLFTS